MYFKGTRVILQYSSSVCARQAVCCRRTSVMRKLTVQMEVMKKTAIMIQVGNFIVYKYRFMVIEQLLFRSKDQIGWFVCVKTLVKQTTLAVF